MNCDEYQELIPEYLEKSLTPEFEQDLKRHLDACDICRKELRQADALLSAVRKLSRREPTVSVSLAISEAIHQSVPPPRRSEFGPVLDLDDLSQYLRLDKTTLDIYLDELPHFELGGKLLFRRKSVDQWIETRERSTAFQINDAFLNSITASNS